MTGSGLETVLSAITQTGLVPRGAFLLSDEDQRGALASVRAIVLAGMAGRDGWSAFAASPEVDWVNVTSGSDPASACRLSPLVGAEDGEADEGFDLALLLFDGRDEPSLAHARAEWRRLKEQGRAISYWRESDEGGWEQAR